MCYLLVFACRVDLSVSWLFEDLAEKEDFEERGKKAPFLRCPHPDPLKHGVLLKLMNGPHIC